MIVGPEHIGHADCIVRLDEGDYYQHRGGYDWGRAGRTEATVMTLAEAAIVCRLLSSWRPRVCDSATGRPLPAAQQPAPAPPVPVTVAGEEDLYTDEPGREAEDLPATPRDPGGDGLPILEPDF